MTDLRRAHAQEDYLGLSHLTSGASVHPENTVTYSAGKEGQRHRGVFSETAPLQKSSPSMLQSAIFCGKRSCAL